MSNRGTTGHCQVEIRQCWFSPDFHLCFDSTCWESGTLHLCDSCVCPCRFPPHLKQLPSHFKTAPRLIDDQPRGSTRGLSCECPCHRLGLSRFSSWEGGVAGNLGIVKVCRIVDDVAGIFPSSAKVGYKKPCDEEWLAVAVHDAKGLERGADLLSRERRHWLELWILMRRHRAMERLMTLKETNFDNVC